MNTRPPIQMVSSRQMMRRQDPLVRLNEAQENKPQIFAFFGIFFLSLLTFSAFMFQDPEPDPLMAISAAISTGVMLLGMYQLYLWNILISPAAAALLGPGWVLFYGIGNLGARLAGEGRFSSNPGSLRYFPLATFLSTVGITLFCICVFFLFRNQTRRKQLRPEDLVWFPHQAVFATIFTVATLVYMSSRYTFDSGYFRGVSGVIDQWLGSTFFNILALAVLISSYVLAKDRSRRGRLIGALCLMFLLVMCIGLRSRTFLVLMVIMIGVVWITMNPKTVWWVLPLGILTAGLLVAAGTVVKQFSRGSIGDNLLLFTQLELATITEGSNNSFDLDSDYRLAGIEFPATILMAYDRGATPLYGEGIISGFTQMLPNFVRAEGAISERASINQRFKPYGLRYDDSIGIPLTTGLTEFGVLFSPFIYVIIALFCVAMWRFMQVSPLIFVAYLMAGPGVSIAAGGVGDLQWETMATLFKNMGFAVIILIALRPLLMPRLVQQLAFVGQTEQPAPEQPSIRPPGRMFRPGLFNKRLPTINPQPTSFLRD
jgi:hypothetical protein